MSLQVRCGAPVLFSGARALALHFLLKKNRLLFFQHDPNEMLDKKLGK